MTYNRVTIPDDLKPLLDEPPLLTTTEAAPWTRRSRFSLHRAIKSGRFPVEVVTINGRNYIKRESLLRFLMGESESESAAV